MKDSPCLKFIANLTVELGPKSFSRENEPFFREEPWPVAKKKKKDKNNKNTLEIANYNNATW